MPGLENSPEQRGWIRYDAANEAAADEFVEKVTVLSEEMEGIQADFFMEKPYDPSFIGRLNAGRDRKLFSWVVDPQTGENIAVVTKENMDGFEDASKGSARAINSRSTRFFRAVARRTLSNLDMDDGGYIVISHSKDEELTRPGIRVIRSLELLRKLKNGQITDPKANKNSGLKGLGEVSIDFFERYCSALFPRADIEKAIQEIDVEGAEAMLRRSKRRLKVWGWIGEQATGTAFYGKDAAKGAGVGEDQSKIGTLEEMGLISRMPMHPNTRVGKDMNYFWYPFVKLHDDRWEDLNELIARAKAVQA